MKEIDIEEKEKLIESSTAIGIIRPKKNRSFCWYIPPIIFMLMLQLYFFFWNLTYFVPILFKEYTPHYMNYLTLNVFPSSVDYFNEDYIISKGYKRIVTEFVIFSFCFINLLGAFIMAYFTNPGEIPQEEFWQIKLPSYVNSQMEIESIALSIISREELLESNKNKLNPKSITSAPSSSELTVASPVIGKCQNNKESNEEYFYQIHERSDTDEVRYCKTCLCFKPDRSHHCRICKTCILKMDHHCPYIGCCIGYYNYKYFNLLLLYSWIETFMFLIIYNGIIINTGAHIIHGIFYLNEIILLTLYSFTICLFLFSFLLWSFHVYLDTINITTFEYVEMNRKRLRQNNEGNNFSLGLDFLHFGYKSRYNSGSIYTNLKQVYGENVFLWLMPFPPSFKAKQWNNGINFQMNDRYQYEIIKTI